MDITKEHLIKKLLKDGKITKDDAIVLGREEQAIEYLTPPPVNPFIPQQPLYPQPFKKNDWISEEMNRRQKIAENCPCNPANGGSGMCGCVMTGPIITC